jgi:hypothetical protein
MTEEQRIDWARGKPIAEVMEKMGGVPDGFAVLVAMLPKNGRFNRCSACRTALTSATMNARAMTITSPAGKDWSCMVIVCGKECGDRIVGDG